VETCLSVSKNTLLTQKSLKPPSWFLVLSLILQPIEWADGGGLAQSQNLHSWLNSLFFFSSDRISKNCHPGFQFCLSTSSGLNGSNVVVWYIPPIYIFDPKGPSFQVVKVPEICVSWQVHRFVVLTHMLVFLQGIHFLDFRVCWIICVKLFKFLIPLLYFFRLSTFIDNCDLDLWSCAWIVIQFNFSMVVFGHNFHNRQFLVLHIFIRCKFSFFWWQ